MLARRQGEGVVWREAYCSKQKPYQLSALEVELLTILCFFGIPWGGGGQFNNSLAVFSSR